MRYDVRDLANTFDTPYGVHEAKYIGHPFRLVRMVEDELNPDVVNYTIRFADGHEYNAWEEEIFPGEIRVGDETWVHRDVTRAEEAIYDAGGAWAIEHPDAVGTSDGVSWGFNRKTLALWVFLTMEHSRRMAMEGEE